MIAHVRSELRGRDCELNKLQMNTLIESVLESGFCSLANFIRDGSHLIGNMDRIDAASKTFLRKISTPKREQSDERERSIRRSVVVPKAAKNAQERKIASAEDVLKCINLAAAMRVERPECRPLQMIDNLVAKNPTDASKKLFLEVARLEAICGNMVTIKAAATALRCWRKFGLAMGLIVPERELPPTVDGLLAWSRVFAVKGTFSNYMAKLSLACEIAGVSRKSFSHPSIARAKTTIGSAQAPPKPKHGIRLPLLEKLVTLASMEQDSLSVLLYVLSYAFLLRVPSEGLPVVVGKEAENSLPLKEGVRSRLVRGDSQATLRLKRRKNLPNGSAMTRRCWCASSSITCPVHCLKAITRSMPAGFQPYKHVSGQDVLLLLRERLKRLGVPFAETYETKDFRRGHARDLIDKPGSCLKDVMKLGQWRSSALFAYLDIAEIEEKTIIEAHIAESDSEGEEE